MESKTEISINQGEDVSTEEKIRDRFSQTRTDRMVEYLTGLRLDDDGLVDIIEKDQFRIRDKYGLPSREYKFTNPIEYERHLRGLAELNGVEIRSKSDCGSFFSDYPIAAAVYMDHSKSIGVGIDKGDIKKYFEGLTSLEHETIHSLQDKYFPEMPIEVMEYEAYAVAWSLDYLRSNKEALKVVFDFGVSTSVNYWYEQESERLKTNVSPGWNSPEYFLLKVDGINQEKIDEYIKENTEG